MSRGLGRLQRLALELVASSTESPIRVGGISVAPAGSATMRAIVAGIWGMRAYATDIAVEVDASRAVLNCTPSQRTHLNRAVASLEARGLVTVEYKDGIQDERVEHGVREFGWFGARVVRVTTKGRKALSERKVRAPRLDIHLAQSAT